MANISRSRLYSGLGIQVKVIRPVLSSYCFTRKRDAIRRARPRAREKVRAPCSLTEKFLNPYPYLVGPPHSCRPEQIEGDSKVVRTLALAWLLAYKGTLRLKKTSPWNHHRIIGTGLLKGANGARSRYKRGAPATSTLASSPQTQLRQDLG